MPMPLDIIRGDIAKIQADAIINTTNTALQKGGGVCGAIFKAAGAGDLQRSCDKIGSCKIGSAVRTEGFKLSKHIIHTVGPVWQGGNNGERNTLYACYRNSLALARKFECESVAFPLISSGANSYPNEKALRVAIKAISDFLLENDMNVLLVLLKDTQFSLSGKLHSSIQKFINENYTDEQQTRISRLEFEALRETATLLRQPSDRQVSNEGSVFKPAHTAASSFDALKNIIDDRANETFPRMLFRLIDERQERFPRDSDVYRRANITKSVFSAIRSKRDYQPTKNTAISLAVALELSLDITLDLLGRAGYTLSPGNTHDLIVKYFISEKEYDIHRINETLYQYGQNLLGASAK